MLTQSSHWLSIVVVAVVWLVLLFGLGVYFDHEVSATPRSWYTTHSVKLRSRLDLGARPEFGRRIEDADDPEGRGPEGFDTDQANTVKTWKLCV
jgi:hypothetical protein